MNIYNYMELDDMIKSVLCIRIIYCNLEDIIHIYNIYFIYSDGILIIWC